MKKVLKFGEREYRDITKPVAAIFANGSFADFGTLADAYANIESDRLSGDLLARGGFHILQLKEDKWIAANESVQQLVH